MENSSVWQGAILGGILFWLFSSSYLNLTLKLRSFLQPFVIHYVQSGTPILLQIQVTNPIICFSSIFYLFNVFLLNAPFLPDAELQGWLSWCPFFWVVLCCFCTILHCFSPFAFLGMYNSMIILYKNFIQKLLIYIGILLLCRVAMVNWLGRWRCWWRFVII